jgi:hypothetical protein
MKIERVRVGTMRIGPEIRDWVGPDGKQPRGDCSDCGGDCGDPCGTHPAGCFCGGPGELSCYWMIADGCDRYHGEGSGGPLYPKVKQI